MAPESRRESQGESVGGCLCGAVRYRVSGPLREVIDCHCTQCQRWSGHFVAATAVERDGLEILDSGLLRWFESSPGIRRGFCGRCGSSLFWEDPGVPSVSIMAGTLDQPSGLSTLRHIYVADKGDYHQIADGLPQFQKSKS